MAHLQLFWPILDTTQGISWGLTSTFWLS